MSQGASPFLSGEWRAPAGDRGHPPQKINVMNALSRWKTEDRWNPLREMEELHRRMDSLFGSGTRRNDRDELSMTVSQWSPLVDIVEDDKEYVICAEIPEMKREDLRVSVENNVLTLRGERKLEQEEKNKKFHRIERAYGNFSRSFSLPDDVDGSKVNAEFKDGVLKVHLPKSPQAKPRSVEVKVA
jgi:HSP20 family protein